MALRDTLKEGPEYVPEHKVVVKAYTTCGGCRYYQSKMKKSGRNPEFNRWCEHSESKSRHSFWGENLEADYDGIVHTPDWCPFLKDKTNENEISKEGSETI